MKLPYTLNLTNEEVILLRDALLDKIEEREKGEDEFFHMIPKLEGILEQLLAYWKE